MAMEIERSEAQNIDMANCLMLLSKVGKNDGVFTLGKPTQNGRVFTCKTCNREFPSFQALGGHRASHKKPQLDQTTQLPVSPKKPKTHECSICGLEFAIGQALGGHMRRHRGGGHSGNSESSSSETKRSAVVMGPATLTMKKTSKIKRVFGLDLNLTPLENDCLRLGLGKVATTSHHHVVDCFM
ncbi:zinc finger protein ZAT12-like [Carica papaya]|uniref:zinc finger protein ZAT12-like n=1 Tax=Carica papaya TaxID=3649 RepID=UPI000B8C729E|nr:zinc finger protein ZAT12-like [Carica papaya]